MLPVGTEVYYEGMYGTIDFVCDSYMTVCVCKSPDKSRDVCILVYPQNQNKLELVNGNHSHEP
jgi:hypothetical protein